MKKYEYIHFDITDKVKATINTTINDKKEIDEACTRWQLSYSATNDGVYTTTGDFPAFFFPNTRPNADGMRLLAAIKLTIFRTNVIMLLFTNDGNTYYTMRETDFYRKFQLSKNKMREKLQKSIRDYDKTITLWQSVQRVYKKDGNDFANIAKNFKGNCLTFEKDYNWQTGNLTGFNITVTGYTFSGYATDTIYNAGKTAIVIYESIQERIAKLQEHKGKCAQELKAFNENAESVADKIINLFEQSALTTWHFIDFVKDLI